MLHNRKARKTIVTSCKEGSIMTRSATILSKLLFFGMPAIAIIPNLILWYTEGLDLIQGLASVLLPFGLYWLIMSSAIRIGRCAVWFAIVLLLAAFEIVLLYLYGNSVISVDMWSCLTGSGRL